MNTSFYRNGMLFYSLIFQLMFHLFCRIIRLSTQYLSFFPKAHHVSAVEALCGMSLLKLASSAAIFNHSDNYLAPLLGDVITDESCPTGMPLITSLWNFCVCVIMCALVIVLHSFAVKSKVFELLTVCLWQSCTNLVIRMSVQSKQKSGIAPFFELKHNIFKKNFFFHLLYFLQRFLQ